MHYEHFMKKALDKANEALSEGEFPVGCVIVYQDRILVSGSRTGTTGTAANEIDHAEMIALRRLVELNETMDKSKITLFTTMEPCLMCLGALALSGIGEVVYAYEDVMGGGTRCDLAKLTPLYKNCKFSIVPNVLRDESLKLFKAFFQNPENAYWRGSLLASYTLSQ
ncbi:nucleoside deaminase [Thermodesulfobacteriota bacterium]